MTLKAKMPNIWFGFFCLAFFVGVLSMQHYPMGDLDFFIHLQVVLLTSLGMVAWFHGNSVNKIGVSSCFWLAFFVLMLCQPILHDMTYIDDLIFPLATLFVAFVLSVITVNAPSNFRAKALHYLSITLIICGVLTVVTQSLHFILPQGISGLLLPFDGIRMTGNIAQVNQAGFLIVLALVSLIYHFFQKDIIKPAVVFGYFGIITLIFGVGIGYTAGRAALILCVFAFIATLFYPSLLKKRLLAVGGFSVLTWVGYMLGNLLRNSLMATDVSGLGRLVGEDSLHTRGALLYRAWLAFSENPLFGIGYQKFLMYGIENAEKLSWLENADHAHNIFAHVGAEFGLVGLLIICGFVLILIKPIFRFLRLKSSKQESYILILLGVILLYSLSEYPLWYGRFLFLTAILIAFLDRSITIKSFLMNKLLFILSLALIFGSVYYIYQYDRYMYSYAAASSGKVDAETKVEYYHKLDKVFGFTKHRDLMLFLIIETHEDSDKLIELGHRVLSTTGHDDILAFQTRLLSQDGQIEQAKKYYRVLCIRERDVQCTHTKSIIKAHNQDKMLQQTYIDDLTNWAPVYFSDKRLVIESCVFCR